MNYIIYKRAERERGDRGFVVAVAAGENLVAARGSNLASSPIMVASKSIIRNKTKIDKLPTKQTKRKKRRLLYLLLLPVIQFSEILSTLGRRRRSRRSRVFHWMVYCWSIVNA